MFEPDATLTEPGLDLQRSSATQCTDFQVFGERGSGTNFLTALVRKNLKLRFWQQYGWKHGFPVAVGYSSQSLILGIYRDPVDWLVSLFNVPRSTYAVEVPNDFSEFIRRPFVGVTSHNYDEFWRDGTNATIPDDCPPQHLQCDRHPVTGQLPDTPMALRNLKIAALIGFKLRCANVALIQYERLREDRRVVGYRVGDVVEVRDGHGQTLGLPIHVGLGFYLTWLRHRSGTIWPGVLCHFLYNGSIVLWTMA